MSTNFAVLSELGHFPIHYQIIKQMIGYWHHLENLESSFPLLLITLLQNIDVCLQFLYVILNPAVSI
jgi:hypothetical protein